MDKQLLAKLYADAYIHADEAKIAKYGQQILDVADFGEVYIESEDLTVSHQLVWYHRLEEFKTSFPVKVGMNKSDAKRLSKYYSEESLLSKLTLAEQAYENCSTLEGYHPKKTLGEMYTAMGFYYPANDQGKESVRGLVARANQHGVDKYLLMGLLSCPAVPEDVLAELEGAELEIKKKFAIARMQLTVAFSLESGKKTLQTLKAEPLTEDYLKEVFKVEVENNRSIPEKAKQLLDEGGFEFNYQLVYAPTRFTKWTSTPALYNWRYSPSEGYVHWGSFEYGGGGCSEIKSVSSQPLVNDFIIDTAKNGKGEFSFVEAQNNYMAANPIIDPPSEIRVRDMDARSAFVKAKKISDYMISEFTCQVRAEYEYDNIFVYCPVYFVWLKAGEYIFKGVVDGCNPTHVEIWEAARVEGTEDIQFYVTKSKADKDLHLRDRTQEKKTAKRASKNKLLNGIFFVLSLIPTLLALISGKIEDFVGVVPAIAILVLFAIKGGATKKAVRVICTVLIVIAIVASALLLVPHSSSAVPSALLK